MHPLIKNIETMDTLIISGFEYCLPIRQRRVHSPLIWGNNAFLSLLSSDSHCLSPRWLRTTRTCSPSPLTSPAMAARDLHFSETRARWTSGKLSSHGLTGIHWYRINLILSRPDISHVSTYFQTDGYCDRMCLVHCAKGEVNTLPSKDYIEDQ